MLLFSTTLYIMGVVSKLLSIISMVVSSEELILYSYIWHDKAFMYEIEFT